MSEYEKSLGKRLIRDTLVGIGIIALIILVFYMIIFLL
jgi:hypothetical protein